MLLLCAGVARAQVQVVTGLAVVVNDSVITFGDIENRIGDQALTRDRRMQKLHDQAIEQMVEEKLIMHDFVSSGYLTNLLEAYVDDRIKDFIRNRDYGSRATLDRTLHAKGQTYESFRREQREQLIIGIMISQNSSNLRKILISPMKVEQYYQSHQDEFKMDDQVKLRMIVLPKSSDSATDTAKQMGEEILAKVDSGVPFAEMAQVNSSDPESAKGGDRGWVERNYFVPELAKIAFALKPGQHSGVIELPEKCYLLMVDDVKPAHTKALSEVRGDIERTLRNDESLHLKQLWIQRLKRKSWISTY
jgi:parvulin-like peptidyl-prolyl isomerase